MNSQAKWIWCKTAEPENVYVDFFADFEVSDPAKAKLEVCAVNQYSLFIDEEFFTAGQYEDWQEIRHYQTYALKDLKPGKHVLMIRVFHQGVDCQTHRNEIPGVIFDLTENGNTIACSCEDIKCRQVMAYKTLGVPYISPQLGYGVTYDARKENYEAGGENAVIADVVCELIPRAIPQLEISQPVPAHILSQGVFFKSGLDEYKGMEHQYSAMAFREKTKLFGEVVINVPFSEGIRFKGDEGDGVYFFMDLGREMVGFMDFDIDVPEGTKISVSYGEHMYDLRVRSDVGPRHFCYDYTAKGGRDKFLHAHRRIAGRYIQVYIEAMEGTLYYAGLRSVDYPIFHEPKVSITDRLERKIYEMSKTTLRLCMHDHFEDCPWREQAMYAMDGRAEMLAAYYGLGEYDMPREGIKLLAQGMHEDGQLELCPPGTLSVVIPSFTYCWVSELNDYMVFTKDMDTVKELWPTVQTVLDKTIARITDDGLIPNFPEPGYWNFYEWDQDLDGGEIFRDYAIEERYELPLIAFIILALQDAANMARKLGDSESKTKYDAAAATLMSNVEKFWDEEHGCYAAHLSKNGDKICYADLIQALLLNCYVQAPDKSALNEAHLRSAYNKLCDKSLQKSTIGGCLYKYRGMLEFDPECTDIVFNEIADDWSGMIYAGATSFWETLRGAGENDRGWSLCHGWAALPVYFYTAYGMGVRPDTVYPDEITQHETKLSERFPGGDVRIGGAVKHFGK